MDLRSLMNDGPAPEKKPSQSSPSSMGHASAARANGSHASPSPALSNGAPGQSAVFPAAGYPPPGRNEIRQNAPIYGPPSSSVAAQGQPQTRGLTPLRTPGRGSGPSSGSYPFPQQQQQQSQHQPLQSPATAGPLPPSHRTYETYPSGTPGARPSSYGNPYGAQPSPSQYGPGAHPPESPSSSSHHSQTPHSVHQSPHAMMGHPPPPHPPSYQHSQPSTPLGPPTHVPRQHSNQILGGESPFRQRTVSGASNGYPAHSPALHQSSIGSLIESPTAHPRPSPRRSASEYASVIDDRGRSESVSPKTKLPPRPPSLGSRHSSQQELHSARSSLQPSTSVASFSEVPGHVQQSSVDSHQAHSASAVPQDSSKVYGQTGTSNPLSVASNKQIPPALPPVLPSALQHQQRPMGMSHLLAPTQHESSIPPAQNHSLAPTPSQPPPTPQRAAPHPIEVSSNGAMHSSPNMSSQGLKRSATDSEISQPPAKRERRRKYTERPTWARLHPSNPRLRVPGVMPNGPDIRAQPHQLPNNRVGTNGAPQVQSAQQVNGQQPQPPVQGAPAVNNIAPWLENPPIDHDMLRMRRLLGAWEKTIKWTTPLPSLTKAVTDWLVQQLLNCQDVAQDPKEGQIEIEAKVGRLYNQQTGQRFTLPVMNMVVVSPAYADVNCTFQSEMQEHEHKAMNEFLNREVRETHEKPGRQKLLYERLEETDTFARLSKIGIGALPEPVQRRQTQRDPKLRTTTEANPKTNRVGQVKARIIKVKLADLHIYNPSADYDLRITMNVECNLMRSDLDPSALVEEATPDKPTQPARNKNRLSYKHLNGLYQIDLTRVDQVGMAPKYELELEVDAGSLRKQLGPLLQGGESGFTQIVDGFIDNATLLMEHRRAGP